MSISYHAHKRVVAMFLAALSSLAIAQEVDPFGKGAGLSSYTRIRVEDKNFGYVDTKSLWPSTPDGKTVIFVCWESGPDAKSAEAEWVRQAVAQSWQAHSRLTFKGWLACAPRSSGIRIQVIDDSPQNGPHTKGLGKALDGRLNGMVLNFTFKNWGQDCAAEKVRKSCIASIAVHEFGHALGFAHEQNRPDKPGECKELRQGSDGTVLLTPYDPKSVMNYCNVVYNNNGVLSRYDIVSVQTVYGGQP